MSNVVSVNIRMYDNEKYIGTLTVPKVRNHKLIPYIDSTLKQQRKEGLSGLRTNVMVRDAETNRLIKWVNK